MDQSVAMTAQGCQVVLLITAIILTEEEMVNMEILFALTVGATLAVSNEGPPAFSWKFAISYGRSITKNHLRFGFTQLDPIIFGLDMGRSAARTMADRNLITRRGDLFLVFRVGILPQEALGQELKDFYIIEFTTGLMMKFLSGLLQSFVNQGRNLGGEMEPDQRQPLAISSRGSADLGASGATLKCFILLETMPEALIVAAAVGNLLRLNRSSRSHFCR